jgi:hypothetical protein
MLLKRKLNKLHDYITNIMNPYMTEGKTVMSLSASLLETVSVSWIICAESH